MGYDRRRLGPAPLKLSYLLRAIGTTRPSRFVRRRFTDNPKSSELTALALVWVIENVRAPLCF